MRNDERVIDADFEVIESGAQVPARAQPKRRLSWKWKLFWAYWALYIVAGILFTHEGQDLTGLDMLPTIGERATPLPGGE